jgi:hypothetical protein
MGLNEVGEDLSGGAMPQPLHKTNSAVVRKVIQ